MKLTQKILPAILLGVVFFCVVYFVTPPKSWADSSIWQILIFFLPLLFFLTFLLDLFLKTLPKSFAISLGVMLLLVLKAADLLNPISLIITAVAAVLLSLLFKRSLTREPKIPKLIKLQAKKRGR